ncbi:uncharacterized protein LOC107834036 [Poecilia formosa]|uniref:uncharacterized protein LOC107834036 n=1 Tax=Poecilia formosa TaxID=48698 RepID=UPI0007B8DB1B|nr:PREDICTED: uncharacterized protein LOC107834036 [Poecilia formosa]
MFHLLQVRKEFKRRTGAEYLEVIPDCELIPNQMYKLTGAPVIVIQPKISKFLNFTAYDNFLPSFEVRLLPDVTMVMLELTCHVALHPVIGCFFDSADCEVWSQVVRLTGESESWRRPTHRSSDPADVTLQLFRILTDLRSEDLKTFQHLLTLQPDPVAVSRLEDADAIRTVDLMIQQYRPERAKEETLRNMNQNQLAEKLERS